MGHQEGKHPGDHTLRGGLSQAIPLQLHEEVPRSRLKLFGVQGRVPPSLGPNLTPVCSYLLIPWMSQCWAFSLRGALLCFCDLPIIFLFFAFVVKLPGRFSKAIHDESWIRQARVVLWFLHANVNRNYK